jgi:hypothetical protein
MRAACLLVLLTATAAAAEPSRAPVVQVAVARERTCALHADGAVSCWGADRSAVPMAVVPAGDAIQLALTDYNLCLLRKTGAVACLGRLDHDAQATTPTLVEQPPAVQLSGPCTRTRDGHVACAVIDRGVALVDGITDAIDVSARVEAGCAVRANGHVVCWQQKWGLPLGAPAEVAGVEHAVQVATGDNFACARTADGHVRCWGAEYEGQLGRGKIVTKGPGMGMRPNPTVLLPPAPVAKLRDVTSIAAGARYACALLADATVACWGTQYPSRITLAGPTAVAGLAHISALAVGNHACALGDARDIMCWGTDERGELGNGWADSVQTPHDVPGIRSRSSTTSSASRTI